MSLGPPSIWEAPLNFAAHARKLGHEVFLVSAVGDDERGRRALAAVRQLGVACDFIQIVPDQPTGTAEVELDPSGRPMFRIVRPAAYDWLHLTPELRGRIAQLQPDWIYFGTLFHTSEHALAATLALLQGTPSAQRFYDVNLREGNWNLTAVEQLATQANAIKLSDSEAEFLDASLAHEGEQASIRHFCERWCDQFKCRTICVTLGERGCVIYHDRVFTAAPAVKVEVVDTIGAGDAFAAAFVHGLGEGWGMERCATFANAVAALKASRHGAIPEWSVAEVWALLAGKEPEGRQLS